VFKVSGGGKIPDEQGGADRDTRQLIRDYVKQVREAGRGWEDSYKGW
jgi:hypothetical protein